MSKLCKRNDCQLQMVATEITSGLSQVIYMETGNCLYQKNTGFDILNRITLSLTAVHDKDEVHHNIYL